ncbi:MAG TPA: hypothetical protein VFB26_11105 [Gaiellaceae bacterium]|nr:hypothetical protein [Gaiellaceae bacterium]
MPKASKQSASEHVQMGPYEGHLEHFDGGYTVAFESYAEDVDATPFFAGLPDDRCQSPHWGYVVRGKVAFRFADREEVYEAGDAYYAPPGHTPVLYAGAEIVEFSPSEDLARTMEVVSRNLEAAGQPA